MIELGPGADLFRMVGWLFWILVFGALLAGLLIPKGWIAKLGAASLVVALFMAFPGRWAWEQKQESDAFRARLSKAEALFKERCKTAGEKIYRTVEGVEGFMLMKVRPYQPDAGYNQNTVDPYGAARNPGGASYIFSLLAGQHQNIWENRQSDYGFAETIDPRDGVRYRYTVVFGVPKAGIPPGGKLIDSINGEEYLGPEEGSPPRRVILRQPATGEPLRYGIDFEDLTTPEERSQWVAGGAVRIIDLQTKEIVAERIGYMMDRGLGGGAGADRSPWGFAALAWSCPNRPPNSIFDSESTRLFVLNILKPKEQ